MANRERTSETTHNLPDDNRDCEEPHRSGRGRVIVLVIGCVVALIAIIVVVRYRASTQSKQDAAAKAKGRPAVPVAVVPVQQRDIPVFLDGLGNVNALNTVTVKTRIDGQLLRFDFQEGQIVRAGEEIALIDPGPSEAALAQATANRFKDEATLENTRHDLERFAGLYHAGVIPQQQYDTQQSQVRVSEGTVKADDAQIQQARLNLAYCHIKAPITGRVGIRAVDPGNIVHASDANGLVVITQMQPIAVLFTLPEDNLSALTQHQGHAALPVEVWNRDLSQKVGTGRLLTIDNVVDPNTGTFRCKAVFDNTDQALFPNQFVNARLQIDVRRGAMTIPSAAVQHGSQGTYVYVVGPDKTAEMRVVEVAMTEGTTAVIGNGVKPGEEVVTEGADKLQPHGKVEISGERGGGGARAGKATPGGGHGGHSKAKSQP